MAKLRIKKIEIAAAVSDSEKIIKLLQRRGVVEISEPEKLEKFTAQTKTEELGEVQRRIQASDAAEKILSRYSKEKKGLLSSLKERKRIDDDEFEALARDSDALYALSKKVIELDKKISENRISVVRLTTLIDSLKPWETLEIPLDFKGTENIAVLLGSFPAELSSEDILTFLANTLPESEAVECETVYSSPEQTCAAVFCMKSESVEIEASLRAKGFVRLTDPPADTAKSRIEKITAEIEELSNDTLRAEDELRKLADDFERISYFADYCVMEKDKLSALEKSGCTEHIFVLTGFVPEIKSEKLKNDIEEKFIASVTISEPEENDDVPVLLKNSGFAAPVEGITEKYSLPGKNDIDPTPIMAFFYYFFFGMMLSDAGYGLIIAVATGIALLKFKMENKMRNTVRMYFFCGISTVFWGAMYGSWFGDMPNIIGSNFFNTEKFSSTAIWIDPLQDLMKLLVYCFIFGLVHLFTGVGLKAYTLFKNGKKLDAFCESVPTFVAIIGLCPVFFGLFTEIPAWFKAIGTPILIVGVILVIATAGRESKSIAGKIGGGLYGLYNLLSGYLGDVLSYARLLALGLSTGVIAQVVNMLCTLPNSNTLKLIMLIVVGTFGHIANLAINIIGAYVHTNRLQYVEFFSKFYEGGGRAMRPLKINTKSFKFKEEN